MPDDSVVLIPILGGLLAGVCLIGAQLPMKRLRLISDLPTSKTTGVFIGLVELKGTAEAEQPLLSYLAGRRCVQYRWRVEERWSRIVRKTSTDSKGRTKTTTRHESGWTTVASGAKHIPFYLQDDCGVIRILPAGAKIDGVTVFRKQCSRRDPLYYGKGPRRAVGDSDHVRRFSETAIPLHARLYVVGKARERADVVAPEIAHQPGASLFLISTHSEEQVAARYCIWYRGLMVLGGMVCAVAFVIYAAMLGIDPGRDWSAWLVPLAVYAAAACVLWTWTVYNSLVGLRNRVRRGWSTVEVQLKRRNDLIPGLVQIVTGLRDHERTVQAELAELRTQLRATGPGQPGPDIHGCLPQLLAIAERYPELNAHESFLRLQQELADTEHRIALARSYYNEITSYYNTRLEQVPDRFVAALGGMRRAALITAEDFEREPVQVSLAS